MDALTIKKSLTKTTKSEQKIRASSVAEAVPKIGSGPKRNEEASVPDRVLGLTRNARITGLMTIEKR